MRREGLRRLPPYPPPPAAGIEWKIRMKLLKYPSSYPQPHSIPQEECLKNFKGSMWAFQTIQWFYHFKAKCSFWICLLWIVCRPFPAIVLQWAFSSMAWVHHKHSSMSLNICICTLQTSKKWTLLTWGCFVQFLYKRQNHYKPTQTERATWQNSDVWTLRTKIEMYRDKYHFTIGIHKENEARMIACNLHLFTNFTSLQNQPISPTDADVPFPGHDKSRHKRACPVHASREWKHTISFARER